MVLWIIALNAVVTNLMLGFGGYKIYKVYKKYAEEKNKIDSKIQKIKNLFKD